MLYSISYRDRKLLYEPIYNMEPGDSKEKAKASTQTTIADKNKTTKEPEVTDAEKKVKF